MRNLNLKINENLGVKQKMRKFGLTLVVALGMVASVATAAFAAHSDQNAAVDTWAAPDLGIAGNQTTADNGRTDAVKDNNTAVGVIDDSLDCAYCHEAQTKHSSGPHGGYQTTTNRCLTCHGLHANANSGNSKAWTDRLLPGTDVQAVCNYCHDLTQSNLGPYYTNFMAGEGKVVQSAHRVTGIVYSDTEGSKTMNMDTLIIPGGSYVTGGAANLVTSGQGALSGNAFTCNSCHTPHAVKGSTVDPYFGESHRLASEVSSGTDTTTGTPIGGEVTKVWFTDRLLKARLQDPNRTRTVTDRTYTKYGSDWCAGCHQGRYDSAAAEGRGEVHNHPVAMGAGNDNAQGYQFFKYMNFRNGFSYDSVIAAAVAGRDAGTYPTFLIDENTTTRPDGTVLNFTQYGTTYNQLAIADADGRSNRQYIMTSTDPITGNARGDAYVAGVDAIDNYRGGPSCQQCHGSAREVEDAFHGTGEPEAQTFPHVSENKYLLVENNDDFCTNCHGLDNLP